ncbi:MULTISPECIES: hypothetical protein [Methylomonas]|uniref:Uncharacterized protein n=1 Tax=Methylomonas defluvii TaxID=3045149 RepID=A0ABU4UD62_9GAMM|nr:MULTISPECIES: hypothetical protein [unclassified Methylomonas]MDX8126882.1 hypothetical protein [Methylomonas sp. OY6]
MIRLGDKLRLSDREQHAFRVMTNRAAPPKTVSEYNAALQVAADAVRDKDTSAESRLLQAVLLGECLQQE